MNNKHGKKAFLCLFAVLTLLLTAGFVTAAAVQPPITQAGTITDTSTLNLWLFFVLILVAVVYLRYGGES